ncbi:MAG TPA: anaerobic ribonucleoside-triphosphate reductase activating protein [Candidatus Aphodousia faecigallinarum]|uniref:Anaerobic ribonucleoside-triphosphate reductase activating protein n=1 Tax=Candidatus Aphodousia faecigallinarum TaxID=2840677 RepID=A0A9D1LF99_9BURK|nr:anaerobic ribonucleoside-triphosphate reductase activating protein [Candidatus Aphodousia faecigallinarum]
MSDSVLHAPAEQLKIAAITPYTSIDYPGLFSAVAFIQGCPWRCRYCHNPHMQSREFPPQYLHSSWEELVTLLKRRRGLLDAVVFSGGEPTLDPALPDAMMKVREMGFKIGLHTSGCYPEHLKEVIHLVDWVGLDVKASICDAQAYRWITGLEKSDPARNVSEALQIIQDAHVTYECRTTAHPDYLPDEKILKLAHELKDRAVENFALQIYRKPKELELPFENVGHEYPEPETIQALKVVFDSFELRRE